MNIIAKLLRAAEPASAELRRELAALNIPAKAATIEQLRVRRRQQLLDAEDGSTLDVTERALTEAQREHDRAIAQHEEMTARLAEAEKREQIDALTARKAALAERVERHTKALQRDYSDLIDEIAAIVREDTAVRQAVNDLNSALAAVGTTERVQQPPAPLVRLMDRLAELLPGGVAGLGTGR